MRKINLAGTRTFSFSVPRPSAEDQRLKEIGAIGPSEVEELETAKYNGGMFIWGASEVEKEMNDVIAVSIVPANANGWISPAGGFFRQHFLEASHLGFSGKIRIIEALIEERLPMSNSQRKEFSEKLRRVQRYRNAFAHGKLEYNSQDGCIINFHEGVHKRELVNDAFIAKLEALQAEALDALKQVKSKTQEPWKRKC
jgi:hypothetical protein